MFSVVGTVKYGSKYNDKRAYMNEIYSHTIYLQLYKILNYTYID